MADLLVHGGGTVYLLRPVSPAGAAWVEQHIPDDATWFGGAVAVEHRFIGPIVEGATGDGLVFGRR
jgi:hypothetical protein